MTLKCIIIDDETHVIEQIIDYINDIPSLKLIKYYFDPETALSEIMKMQEKVDILFTDIEMPNLSGLELSSKIRHKVRFLVLVSGHLQYALNGYKIQADDFLAKPFNFSAFTSTVNSIIKKAQLEKSFIFLKTKEDKERVKVGIEDIMYIEAAGNYVTVYTPGKSLTTLLKLSDIEEQLQDYPHFIRIHKSYIASSLHIEKLKTGFISLNNGINLSVSHTYKDNLLKHFRLI